MLLLQRRESLVFALASRNPWLREQSGVKVLKPGQQLAELVSEDDVLGSACLGKSGWLEASCQGDDLHSMFIVGDTHLSYSLDGGPSLESSCRGRGVCPRPF